MEENKKIMLVAVNFPPKLNGGNIRVMKFAKYLNQHGWEVYVLCKAFDKLSEIEQDNKLKAEIEGVKIVSIPGFMQKKAYHNEAGEKLNSSQIQKGFFLKKILKKAAGLIDKYIVPDIYRLLWKKKAAKKAKEIINKNGIFNVMTTSPPHSTQIIGLKLKRVFKGKIQWIADFRDLWSLSPVFEMKIKKNRWLNKFLEKKIIETADKVLVVSDGIKNLTLNEFKKIKKLDEKIEVVSNGFDEDDFKDITVNNDRNEKTVCSYIGSILGPRANNQMIPAVAEYLKNNEESKIEFKFTGIFEKELIEKIKSYGDERLNVNPPVSHDEALDIMLKSDCLILILTNDREGTIALTGKFFEYLRIGKPILALVPEGEVSRIVRDYHIGEVANPDSAEEIISAIKRLYEKCQSGDSNVVRNDDLLKLFNREELTRKLEKIILG